MALETFEFLLNKGFTTNNTTYSERLFNFPTTGLTLITPLNRNTIIREVGMSGFCFLNRTVGTANKGFQINFYQMEYSIVDYDGQFVNVKGGFPNLFVPDPSIQVIGTSRESSMVNEVNPFKSHCSIGGGITITQLAFAVTQFTNFPVNSIAEFHIYVTYEV